MTDLISPNLNPSYKPFFNQWKDNLFNKAREYGIPEYILENSSIKEIDDIIKSHELEQLELTRRTYIKAIEDKINNAWEEESIAKAQALIIKLYDKVKNSPQYSEWQLEILAKAKQYKISYDPNKIDWFYLEDAIEELELLLKEADQYDITNIDYEDLVSLRQDIEEAQRKEVEHRSSLHCEYKLARL
jgi:hypothetical protein